MTLAYGKAICYSGYREGQDPREQKYPSYEQVKEDLLLLDGQWDYLRLYDSGPHAKLVLDVIVNEGLNFKLMLGADIAAEESNPNCPWGAHFSDERLANNRLANDKQISQLIDYAKRYPDIVSAVSIGNEASVEWTDHMVSVERLIEFTKRIKAEVDTPVTFCENYVPWLDKLKPLVEVIDFISIHTYPIWEYQPIESAIDFTDKNYQDVVAANPGVPIVVTEAGWATCANGQGIDRDNASAEKQEVYCNQLLEWSQEHQVLVFLFEAFDEPWKGSHQHDEPEKHWGIYYVDRTPKPFAAEII